MLLTTFGERVKAIREFQGISQVKLSELTGIVREQISRIEHGQINPTLETIGKLSVAFNMPLSELMDIPVENILIKSKKHKIKPFVKWAGGKTQILDMIRKLLPKSFNNYYEPFLGGGALLFDLAPDSAVVSDSNEELIAAFKCFQNDNDYTLLIEELTKHQHMHSEEYYYYVRSLDRMADYNELPIYIKAARMIYLNKTCFNGLYRVNSKGYFNVPSGKYEKVNAYDKELYDNLHEYLSNSKLKIMNADFEEVTKSAKQGDFVYFDPPYDTFDEQNNFTSYSKDAFGRSEQVRLSIVYKRLSDRGVKVMLSNHNTQLINQLYQGFNVHVIQAKRSINSKAAGRGNVEEVIITNY
jgi:DNA adenine methylase